MPQLRSRDMDFNIIFKELNQSKIDFEQKLTDSKNNEADQIITKKLKEQEKAEKKINFVNKHTVKLMQKCPSDVLNELSIRMQTGSRDIPTDHKMALELQEYAAQNATKDFQKENLKFYGLFLKKHDMDQKEYHE